MKKINQLIGKIGVGSALALALPSVALAEGLDYSTADVATDAAAGTAAAGIFAGLAIFWVIFLVIALVFFVFWIIMLVDAFKRTNWQDDSQKNLWLIVLIVSFFVGLTGLAAILYYFIVKRALDKGNKPNPPATPPASSK